MLLPEPSRRGENGPFDTEQVRPQVVLYENFAGSDEIGVSNSSCSQYDTSARKNSADRLRSPVKKGIVTRLFSTY